MTRSAVHDSVRDRVAPDIVAVAAVQAELDIYCGARRGLIENEHRLMAAAKERALPAAFCGKLLRTLTKINHFRIVPRRKVRA